VARVTPQKDVRRLDPSGRSLKLRRETTAPLASSSKNRGDGGAIGKGICSMLLTATVLESAAFQETRLLRGLCGKAESPLFDGMK
jgi:hypothetical protein